jgi:Protein of unknown function (DUF3617)
LALIAGSALLTLAACGEKATKGGSDGPIAASSAPVQRQPGSWSTKIEIVKLEGPDIKGGEKEQLQAMMNMMGNVSICLTPEAVAQEDMSKNLEQLGAQGGECKFDKKDVRGNRISFAATCKSGDGGAAKLSAEGVNDATTQDITISSAGTKPDGKPAGEMVMRITGKRTGDCKPGDITPPTPKAAGATKS